MPNVINSQMKTCKYCSEKYPETDFGVAKTTQSKIYRRRKCRYCYRKTKNILKDKRRGCLAGYKEKIGCRDCGIKDHRVLDFHHKSSKEKDFAISEYYYHQYCEVRLKKEVEKCEILCANCHRIYHFDEQSSH